MRSSYLTLIPMFILAVCIAVVGERLSQRELEVRVPVNRDRLVDFASALELELERLDTLYLDHLEELVRGYINGEDEGVKEFAAELAAVKSISLFSKVARKKTFTLFGVSNDSHLPEVSIEGQKLPFSRNRAVIIPRRKFQDSTVGKAGWILSPEQGHFVYWSHASQGKLVTIVIAKEEWLSVTGGYLKDWFSSRIEPLLDSRANFSISPPDGLPLYASHENKDEGLAVLVMPIRTNAGEWLIQAWDGVTLNIYRDTFTLSLSLLLSVVFILSGYVLYQQQVRSLKLAKQRVSFVNQVSHELGSPLTNVTLNLDLVSETLGDKAIEAKKRIGIITEEVERLNRMIANVLTFSQSERGCLKLHNEPCFPDEVVTKILDSFRPALERRGISIVSDLGVNREVKTDSDALAQIVANLISNVEKYAYSGKWMRVKTSVQKGRLVVGVEDRGIGIPKNARKKIFQSFERVLSSVDEGSSGTGLGLSIARELANKLGGELKLLESGNGCHFGLSVPCEKIRPRAREEGMKS